MHNKKEGYYVHVYTLRDKSTKSIKIKPSRSLKEEILAYQDQKVKNP